MLTEMNRKAADGMDENAATLKGTQIIESKIMATGEDGGRAEDDVTVGKSYIADDETITGVNEVCRKKCNYHNCNNIAQKNGVCVKHGYKKRTCISPGCNKIAVKNGICISNGASCLCIIIGCKKTTFKAKLCHFHYRCSLCEQESDWDPTIMRVMTMLEFEVLEYLGMAKHNGDICSINRWDYVFAIAGVCKSWRAASLNYLNWIKPKIGLMRTHRFSSRKLSVSRFFSYLEHDERFRTAYTIHILCLKADKLYFRDVKEICPAMAKLIHKSWLMTTGNLDHVKEGCSNHSCYWMYRHDKQYIEGETAWIKYMWDEKYKKVHTSTRTITIKKTGKKRTIFYTD